MTCLFNFAVDYVRVQCYTVSGSAINCPDTFSPIYSVPPSGISLFPHLRSGWDGNFWNFDIGQDSPFFALFLLLLPDIITFLIFVCFCFCFMRNV